MQWKAKQSNAAQNSILSTSDIDLIWLYNMIAYASFSRIYLII